MPIATYGEPNYWLTCITIDRNEFGTDREAIRLALEAEDIEARPTWKPLHLQPVFADLDVVGGSVSADIFEHGLCLPSGSNLSTRKTRTGSSTRSGALVAPPEAPRCLKRRLSTKRMSSSKAASAANCRTSGPGTLAGGFVLTRSHLPVLLVPV